MSFSLLADMLSAINGAESDTGSTTLARILRSIVDGTFRVPNAASATSATTATTAVDLDPVIGTASATAGAATLNARAGKITTEALTTAQNGVYTLTLTNSSVAATDIVVASVANGTNTQGSPVVTRTQPAAGSVVILVANLHASAQALNGTLVISFYVVK